MGYIPLMAFWADTPWARWMWFRFILDKPSRSVRALVRLQRFEEREVGTNQ